MNFTGGEGESVNSMKGVQTLKRGFSLLIDRDQGNIEANALTVVNPSPQAAMSVRTLFQSKAPVCHASVLIPDYRGVVTACF
ncbi:hypothetical protein CEXT_427761 [Caerostris extrusa]|uniref:Uncharacterized protein n=1 Tax=Caerostris extrusa TaxID=172846 RepID=A0AAV4NE07_CAEEX|nr:hypothetical protein CEXT_427761 [Caerostris extrusa]